MIDRMYFYRNVRGLVWDSVKNTLVAVIFKFSRGDYKKELARLSNAFSLSSNMMLLMGKKFKTSEMLSGRFADVFSNIYLSYSMLWYYEKILSKRMNKLENCWNFVWMNYYLKLKRFFTKLLQIILFFGRKYIEQFHSHGRRYKSSSDEMKKEISDMVTNPGSVFNLFKENIYIPEKKNS